MKHSQIATLVIAASLSCLLAGCDKPVPSVGTSKAEADSAASSALGAARAAAVETGQALKDTAIAAKHETDAAIAQTREAASSADVQGTLQKAGAEAKQAVTVAADKTRDLAHDAKEDIDKK
jgi:hypothetical protein